MVERKHPLAKCEDCPLFGVGKFVPSQLPEGGASLAIVGEAPGRLEIRAQKPFQGPVGDLVDIVMQHHEIVRDDVVLSYAVGCNAPGGEVATAAIHACQPRLEAELLDAGVDTVVALGNSAAFSLTGRTGVTQLRVGPGRAGHHLSDVRIITTLSPAAALRQGDLFPHIVQDVAKAITPPKKWIPPTYVVAETTGEALSFLEQLELKPGPWAIDIEAGIEKDVSFDHPNKYQMLSVGVGYEKGKVIVFGEDTFLDPVVVEKLGDLLRRRDLIFQNGKFDKAGLFPLMGEVKIWFDTMLASYTFDERPGVHGLDYQGQEHLGAPNWKGVLKPYLEGTNGSYANVPRDILYKYNANDVSVTYDLAEWYMERFDNEADGADCRRVHDFLVAAANELVYLELNGFAIDRAYLKELTVTYLDILENRVKEINEVIGWVDYTPNPKKQPGINPNSPMQIKAYFQNKGIDTASTDVDHIKLILEEAEKRGMTEIVNFCTALMSYRKEAKLYGTYVKGITKRLYGGRVFPTFQLHGTTSGRLACRNPNLQNIPRGNLIRKMFVPANEGNVLVGVDYSQAELRVLSFLAKDVYFRDIFNAGDEDLFDNLTPILYPGKNKQMQIDGLITPFAWGEMRIRVKAFVYGLAYGRESGSIAAEYKLPPAEAKRMMNSFFEVIPEIVDFREQTMRKVLAGEDLISPWGRHRRYTLITDRNRSATMNEALSFLPQSTASDMCLDALTRVRPMLKGIGWIRNSVHDALYAECAREDAEEVAHLIDREMVASAKMIVGDYVVFATDYHIADNWGDL